MAKFVKPDKENLKQEFKTYKQEFVTAIKDKKRWICFLIEIGIMCLLIAVDLLTKHFIYGHCNTVDDIVIIDGVIRFTAVRNTGASFGIAKDHTTALTVISAVSSVLLIFFLFYSNTNKNKWLRSALIMITAGAIGNVVDRIAFGYVRDFVYFELIDFAVFNLADSCLTVGAVVLMIYIIFFYAKEESKAKEKKEETEYARKLQALIDGADAEDNNISNDNSTESKNSENSDAALPDEQTTPRSDEEDK